MAQAEAEAIQRITSSLPDGQAAMYLLGLKYLEALPTLTQGRGTTVFLPTEATGVMGALGGIKELLARSGAAADSAAATRPPEGAGYQQPRPQITATTGTPWTPPKPEER